MKYCLRYRKSHEVLMQKADEWIIKYDKRDTNLPKFLNEHSDKMILIYIKDTNEFFQDNEIQKMIGIKETYPNANFMLKLADYNEELITQLKENNLSFMTDIYVNDWDTFNGLIDAGVSAIYVVESFAFELNKISKKAKEHNVQIRVFPNVAQSKWSEGESLTKFFIRPEDIKFYEDYVNTIEFICDINKEELYYEIYAEDKKWYGKLKEIITGLDNDIDSRSILPRFAEARIKCGKRCAKDGSCQTCLLIGELSKALVDKDVIITTPNKEENLEDIKKL